MGRFMSPDWSAKEEPVPYAKLDNPQSLNLYAYVLNNPVIHLDADGHECKQGDWGCNAWNTVAAAWDKLHQIINPAPSKPATQAPEPASAPTPNKAPSSRCGNQCHVSVAVQIGNLRPNTDGKTDLMVIPNFAISSRLAVDGPTDSQHVLFSPTATVESPFSVSSAIVMEQDGTVHPQGITLSVSKGVLPVPVNIAIPTQPVPSASPAQTFTEEDDPRDWGYMGP
jgi:hypothetical protein